ncbi:hypothetical protein [Helicobacter sp. 23-1045]
MATQIRRIYAIFATLFFALNPYMTYFVANDMLSDVCFLLFCFCAIIILAKLFGNSKNPHYLANGEQNAESALDSANRTKNAESKIDSSLRDSAFNAELWQFAEFASEAKQSSKSICHFERSEKSLFRFCDSAIKLPFFDLDSLSFSQKGCTPLPAPPTRQKLPLFAFRGRALAFSASSKKSAGGTTAPFAPDFLHHEAGEIKGASHGLDFNLDCHDLTSSNLAMTENNALDSAFQTKNAESHIKTRNLDSVNKIQNAESSAISQNLIAESKIKITHPLAPSAREGEEKHKSAREGESSGIFIAIFGGIFMLFSATIRINGFVILCALMAMQGILLAKHFAPRIFKLRAFRLLNYINSPYSWQIHAIPYAIFALGFMLIALNLSSGTSGHFGELAHISIPRIAQNLLSYSLRFNQFFDLGAFDFAILALCLLPFLLRGIFDKFAESMADSAKNALDSAISSSAFFLIFYFGYFALLLLWMETFGVRFVLPLVPFLLFWTFSGIAKSRKFYRFAISVILLLILGSFLHLNYLDISLKNSVGRTSNINAGTYSKESLEVFEIIRQKIPQNAIIISLKPRALYLNTHRIGFATGDEGRLSEADFVLWSAEYEQLNIFNADFQSKTTLIFENSEWKLFKVLKGAKIWRQNGAFEK